MKQKGRRENPPIGVRHRETTRDERMRIITLYDDAKWNWSKIARTLNIDRRTCANIYKRWKHNDTPSNRRRTGRLWRYIETELGEIWGRAADVEALMAMIGNTWRDHITEEVLDRLIDSMPARLQAVIDAGGNPTPY